MSSSSESEEGIIMPVKKLKRRHRPIRSGEGAEKQKISLYSLKILPKLDALTKSSIKMTEEDRDKGNNYVPFDISPIRTPKKRKSSESLSQIGSPKGASDPSPIDIPLSPPPPYNPQKNKRRGGKAKKLLSEVATVLSQISKHDSSSLNDSVISNDDSPKIVKEITVKVRFHGRLQRFPMAENNTFEEIFKNVAQKARVDIARVLITFGDRRVFPSDTPCEINLSIADILECVIAHRRLAPDVKDTIKIQMQGPFQKKKEPFTMGKTEPFLSVMEEYAQKYNTNINRLQFRFDGESLEPTATPRSLDMDNSDCIDVMHLKLT